MICLTLISVIFGYTLTDGTKLVVVSQDTDFVYTNQTYKNKQTDASVTNPVVQYLWQQSPLRAMMIGKTHRPKTNETAADSNTTALVKRSGAMAVGMAVGMSGPSMVGMVQAFSTKDLSSQERADMFMSAAYDMTATILMFAGGPIGVAIGSVMMLTKTFFDAFEGKHGPPQIDPDVFFKQIVEYIQQVIPSADQIFMEMKPYLSEMINNVIDMRFQKRYQDDQQKSLRIISEYLNIYDGEDNPEAILRNWQSLVSETAREMISNKLPLSNDDVISFEIYETATAVAVYPQYVSMLIMAVKEWYLTAKMMGKRTGIIEAKFKQYVAGFRVQYNAMIDYWYTTTRAYIATAHFEKAPTDTDVCLMTVKVPNAVDAQGYVTQRNAARKYLWSPELASSFTGYIHERSCPDTRCRFVKLLDETGANVCSYEKEYRKDCKRPCSEAKQAFSWLIPIFGATDSKCFLNEAECTQIQTGIHIRPETCRPSNCTIQLAASQAKLLSRLEDNIVKVRQTAVRYNSMLDNAKVSDMSNFMEGLQRMQSMSMQKFIPKDEVFNGDVCRGLLAIPKSKGVPKMCVVTTTTRYSCPTMKNGQKQYILYPDVIRTQLPRLCPKYLRPKSDVMTKKKIEAVLGPITDEQFLALKEAKEGQTNIVNVEGKSTRDLTSARGFNQTLNNTAPVGDIYSFISVNQTRI